MRDSLSDFRPEFLAYLREQGYEALRTCGNSGLCAVKRFHFTWGLVVGMDFVSYDRRYCYEHKAEAIAALAAWSGDAHPGGPWIKCKGSSIDLLNPELGRQLV